MSNGWIDIHAHILPGLDDGAETLDGALEMARIAGADGIECMVATPHYLIGPDRLPAATIQRETKRLNRAMRDAGLSLQLLPGAEVQIDPDICAEMEREPALTLAGSRYLLLELPLGDYPLYTEEIIFRLQVAGLQVILAHPERNGRVQESPDILAPLIERGVLTQVTAASITGVFGSRIQRTAEYFLRRNMVHVIATDAHGRSHRRPVLSDAVEAAADIVGRERADAMVSSVPRAIIADEIITPSPLEPAGGGAKKGFWQRLR